MVKRTSNAGLDHLWHDEKGNPLACAICGWKPTPIQADLGLVKVLFRRAEQGYCYVCNACYQDLDEHFAERRRHGPTG